MGNFLTKLINGLTEYSVPNTDLFLEHIDKVKYGRNGAYFRFQGNYLLSVNFDYELRTLEKKGYNEFIIGRPKGIIEQLPIGKYPKLEVEISNFVINNNLIKEVNQINTPILDPILHFNPKTEYYPILMNIRIPGVNDR